MMTNTDALVKGLNPYDMSLQPQLMNQYGIMYPLLVFPFAKIFGTSILIHRLVSAFFIFASCFLISLVLKRMAVPILLNIWTVLMLYASLTYPGTTTPIIDPGSTGMFFMLLTVFIPWFCKFSYPSLIISIICGLFAFYTKLYTFLGALIMLSYLFLFVSKAKGLFYGFLLLILSTISIMVVDATLPAYFDNCLFTSVNMTHSWSSIERLQMQIVLYSGLHQWILILLGGLFLWASVKIIRDRSWGIITKKITDLPSSLKLTDLKEPLIKLHFPLVLFAAFSAAFVLYISLGRHGGAILWYFFQLLSPFFLVGSAWVFCRNTYWPIVCVPFLVLNLFTITADHDCKYFDKNIPGWPEISLLISQHEHILNSPLIAPLLVEQNKEVYDNGLTEYFISGGQRSPLMKTLFKEDPRVLVQEMLFFEGIKDMVRKKEFDLIILQPKLLPVGVGDAIRENYKFEGNLTLFAPQDRKPYSVTVWRPL